MTSDSVAGVSAGEYAELMALMPFAAGVGVELEMATAEQVTGRLAWSADRCTAGGMLHGGALMTLADSVGAICAYLNLPSGATTSTLSSSTAFLRAVRHGHARATALPLHIGRTSIVVQIQVRDDHDRPVAQIIQTQAILASRPSEST